MQPKADGRDKRGKFILLAAGLRSPVVGYTVQRKAIGICIQTRKTSFRMLDFRMVADMGNTLSTTPLFELAKRSVSRMVG